MQVFTCIRTTTNLGEINQHKITRTQVVKCYSTADKPTMKSNDNTRSMIAAVAARRRKVAAATRNATANGNNKKSVSFKTIENPTMTKIAAAAKRRQLFSTANRHKNTTDDEGKIVESSVAANPPSHINIGENSKMTKIAAAAKRRQLSSTANGHKNTTDNEGKIVKSSIAANPPSHINIERIHGGDPPSNVNYHTAITADNKRGTSSKSKGSRTQELIEGDKVELCQWIKSSNSGDHKDFKVGKDRRFALHRLCRTLIDVNPDLLLTHNSYGDSRARILKIQIDTKSPTLIIPTDTAAHISTGSGAETDTTKEATASATAAAAAAALAASGHSEKLERWENSTAKQVLSTLLRDTTSWANTIINADPNFGVLRSRSTNKTIGTIHGRNVLFTRYPLKNFVTNLRSLKNAIDTEFINVDFDQEAYDKEIIKYPMQRMLKVGYPRWNHPDNHAKKLLEEDTKKGGLYEKENLKPKDLKVTRPEYREFPDDVFRSRVYKALSGHREKPYWQNERNKSMRKKKVTEENLQQTEWT